MAGFRVEEHASHFADNAPDAEWLGGNLKAEEMAQGFIAAVHRMGKVLRPYEPPMTASVASRGHVTVLTVGGDLVPKPKSIK